MNARPVACLSPPPLPMLLGRAIGAFTLDYDQARGDGSLPQLGTWANVLRVVDVDWTNQRQLARRAVISTRAAEVVVNRLARFGRVAVERRAIEGKRGKTKLVRLTASGEAGTPSAAAVVDSVQADWQQRFGDDAIDRLGDALSTVVDRLPVKLPHYPAGYGAADPSVTGGGYVPEDPGPPRIPAHGQDWPVVLRKPGRDTRQLPLPALLSQVLAASAIDYERERFGSLPAVSNFLRFVGEDGVTLGRARVLGGVSGNGKTLHERHKDVVVEPGRPSDMNRRVFLTPKARRLRDAYPRLVMEFEDRWREQYAAVISLMRTALMAMNERFDVDLPDHPSTTAWIVRPWLD